MNEILALKRRYKFYWRGKPQSYWLARLQEEVAELTLTLDEQHKGPVSLELREIASICLNWLDMRGEWTEEATDE